MPIYDYECEICHERHQQLNSISNHKEGGLCCGQARKQIILDAPMVNGYFLGSSKNEGYHCVVSDRWVDSKKKRKDVMAEFNVQPKE